MARSQKGEATPRGRRAKLIAFPTTSDSRDYRTAHSHKTASPAKDTKTARVTKSTETQAVSETDAKNPENLKVKPQKNTLLGDLFAELKSQPVLSYYLLLVTTLLLFIIGLILVFSASTISALDNNANPFISFGKRSLIYVASLLVMFVASRLKPGFYKSFAWWFLIASWVLQVMVFLPGFHGAAAGGNTNWLIIPGTGFSIQPSEFMKLALVVFLGRMLSDTQLRREEDKKQWFIMVGIPVLVSLGLVMAGRDLGTAMVMASLILVALFVAGIPTRYFLAIIVLGAFGAAVAVMSSPNRRRRVFGFMDASTSDPTGIGYQRQHGLWSLATGGLTGVGPGASREKWSYLPEADTDYIFAILGEEFGLLGTFLVLGLFAVLCLTFIRIIERCGSRFQTVVVGGIIGWIFSQTLINIGAVVGLLPIIGVPLPLISSGGSSLLSIMGAIGVALCFARHEPGSESAWQARSRPIRRSLAVLSSSRRSLSKTRRKNR